MTPSLALRDDGTVSEWGRGAQSPPPEATNLIAIAAGQGRLGLRDDGRVIAWGLNLSEQTAMPEVLPPAIAIAAAGNRSFALFPTSGEPHLGRQPRRQSLFTGQRLHLDASVLPGAAPVTFQWFRNGRELTSQTNALLEISAVTTANSGNYSVTARNAYGTVTSRDALVSVLDQAPIFGEQPVDLSATEGESATFHVTASGSEPLAYQWFFNGQSLAKATNASFTLSPLTLAEAGAYHVRVQNAFGAISSRPVTLSVAPSVFLARTEFGVMPDGTFRIAAGLSSALSRDVRVRWEYGTGNRWTFDSNNKREGFLVIPAGSLRQCAEIQDSTLIQNITDRSPVALTLVSADLAGVASPSNAVLRPYAGPGDDLECDPVVISPARFEPDEMQLRPDRGVELLLAVTPGAKFTIEVSEDLVFWEAAEGILVHDPSSERVWFMDPHSRERSARFYRIRSE